MPILPEIICLANNVYGVVNLWHPAGIGVNAGFIITKNNIIHIDSGMTLSDGEYLVSKSREIAGENKNLILILTHHHSDHIFGMHAFKRLGAKIIAHKALRDFLSYSEPPSYESIKDTYKQFIINLLIERYSYSKEEAEEKIGDVKLYLPDIVFSDDYEIEVDGEKLILLYTPGHVPSEISIYHPSSKILFAGDTIYSGLPLTTRFGGPKEWRQWINSLKKLEKLNIHKIVSGHGRICNKNEIKRNIEYLKSILRKGVH